jgi:hypothetical protein
LYFAMALAQLFEPLVEWLGLTIVRVAQWDIRQGAYDRMMWKVEFVLSIFAFAMSATLIAARPHNILARFAGPAIVLVVILMQVPEFVTRLTSDTADPDAANPDILRFIGFAGGLLLLTFVCGWIGDKIRDRREAKIISRLIDDGNGGTN